MHNAGEKIKAGRAWLASIIVFAVLCAITALVWKQQADYQQSLLSNHTDDVAVQASRRLQVFVESHLRIGSIFARRWSTHESRDFSKQRFDEFASVLIEELPGYHAVGLVSADLTTVWTVPETENIAETALDPERTNLLDRVRTTKRIVLSAPFRSKTGEISFYAVLPLMRGRTALGYLVVDFHTRTLIDDCFHTRIRSEFILSIRDELEFLYVSSPEVQTPYFEKAATRASIDFPVRNRMWHLDVVPKRKRLAPFGWSAALSVPLLGFFLSVGLSYLVFLLTHRMTMYRSARDKLLREMEERQKVEEELTASRARYRNVFDSATDGLLVLNADREIIEANPAAGKTLGYQPKELAGMTVNHFIVPEQRHLHREFQSQIARTGAAQIDALALRKDGSRVDVVIRGTQLGQSEDGRLLAVISDISEQKRALERLTHLSRKAIAAQEDERARLSMELHDELGQILTALRLEIDFTEKQLAKKIEGRDLLGNPSSLVAKATDELRRICKGLRPPLLDDLGLEPAVEMLVNEFRERSNIVVDLTLPSEENRIDIPKEVAICTYRIVQESMTNILRHSKAKHANISLACTLKELELSIYDNGVGFDLNKLGALRGWGLEGMRERASLVNGVVEIRSFPNEGTRVVLRVPIEQSEDTEES